MVLYTLCLAILGGGWIYYVYTAPGYICQERGNCGSPDGNVNHLAGSSCHLNHYFYTTPEELREGVEWCIKQQELWIATNK